MKAFKNIIWIGMAAMSFLWVGCDRTADPSEKSGVELVNVQTLKLSYQVTVPGAVTTKADYSLEGQDAENVVNTLTFILVGLDGTGAEDRSGKVITKDVTVTDKTAITYSGSVEFSNVGQVAKKQHVYVGANLSAAQIEAFKKGEPIKVSASTRSAALSEVMTVAPGGAGTDIAMFTQATDGDSEDFTIAASVQPSLNVVGTLERLVAKVLLTFTMNSSDASQINFEDRFKVNEELKALEPDRAALFGGWCSLEDIRYIPNTINVEYSLESSSPAEGLSEAVSYNSTSQSLVASSRLSFGSSGFYTSGSPFAAAAEAVTPLAYDPSKVGEGVAKASHYSEGVYCPENLLTNDVSVSDYGKFDIDDIAREGLTYLVVSFRYVPNMIHTSFEDAENPHSGEVSYSSRSDAEAALESDGSFWVNDVKTHEGYYTTAAKEAAVAAGWAASEFTYYQGGVCYYRTLVGEGLASTSDGVLTAAGTSGKELGLRRNTYHLVNVPSVILPGDADLRDYIRVNSTIIDWNWRGTTEMTIIP